MLIVCDMWHHSWCNDGITWQRWLRDGGGVGLQVEGRVVVVEVLHLDSDGGWAAELLLRLLLGCHNHEKKLSLIGILEIKFLQNKLN